MESRHGSFARNIAQHDAHFKAACQLADCKPTKRQAAKWRNERGRAYAKRQEAAELLKPTEAV